MFDALIPKLIALNTDVGKVIMSFYKSDISVQIKDNQTPLTIADKRAHQLIVRTLKKITPNTPILSEESEIINFSERSKWNEYWLIDPLDGTQDFLDKTDEFCICIAYIKNNKSIFGMIYAPLSDVYYYTIDTKRSYKLHNNITTKLQARPAQNPLQVVIGRHSINNKQLKNKLLQCGDYKLSMFGSALKFCLIAEGKYDYYPKFGPCSEWDVAAGTAILQGAGGRVVDENGNTLSYNTKNYLTSPIFFASGKP